MATKKSAKYSDRLANEMSFDLIPCSKAAVTLVGSFIRDTSVDKKDAGYKVSEKEFDPSNKNHRVYVMLEVDDPNYEQKEVNGRRIPGTTLTIPLDVMNGWEGVDDAIEIDGDEFYFVDGAELTIAGNTAKFTVAA